ncbi:MAG: hypothetical protein HYZ18_09115 [Pseudogulbenkiania sp.]|nr:hypothetical protein [Pseudogulbenkiania sp.]
MRGTLLIVAAIFGHPAFAEEDGIRAVSALGSAYHRCVSKWAGEFLAAHTSASNIVDAAEAKCVHYLSAYENAFRDHMQSLNPTGVPTSPTAEEMAKSSSAWVRSETRKDIIKLILQVRSEQ